MGLSRFYKFMQATMLSIIFSTSVSAADASRVQTLSEGACWYEQGEMIKIASFNDNSFLQVTREELEWQVENLLNTEKKNKSNKLDLSLHCGGYGSSLVIKTIVDNRLTCLWLKYNNGLISLRSIGGLEDIKNDICDGYKWGELIVGLKSIDQKSLLESPQLHSMIQAVSVISGTTLKLKLHPEYYGKENFVIEELKKQMSLRYIELNFLQHPVGESASLNSRESM